MEPPLDSYGEADLGIVGGFNGGAIGSPLDSYGGANWIAI